MHPAQGRRDLAAKLPGLALAMLVMGSVALAQTWTGAPAPSPELQAAMTKADADDPAPLATLADAGNADAQYYAGAMYIFGRGPIAKDPARGCAYEQKASATAFCASTSPAFAASLQRPRPRSACGGSAISIWPRAHLDLGKPISEART